ncbi:MAG: hypothetical protein O3B08_10895 [Proteobacteria bacterium]|nr:hypothetical protein [Pseudomonadota bacterium]
MVQSVGFDPLQASLSFVDQRRHSEREPDSTRVTPATDSDAATADRRRHNPADTPQSSPELTRVAFTAKFGPDANGLPLQLIRGDQVVAAASVDLQAIAENRIPQEERQPVRLQSQEATDSTADATRRQQEAAADRQREAGAETSSRAEQQQAAQATRQQDDESAQAANRRQPAGSVLDLRV